MRGKHLHYQTTKYSRCLLLHLVSHSKAVCTRIKHPNITELIDREPRPKSHGHMQPPADSLATSTLPRCVSSLWISLLAGPEQWPIPIFS